LGDAGVAGWGDATWPPCGDNYIVGRARVLGNDVIRRGGTIAGAPLFLGAGVLASFSVIEVLVRADEFGPPPLIPLLLGLCSTLPIVMVRSNAPLAAGLVTGAVMLAIVAPGRPTVAGLLCQVAVLYLVGHRLSAHFRGQAIEQAAARRTLTETVLENAARGERARIARELHDVVAHHISMIAVQADTARLATPGMPAEGSERLVAIGDTARAALTEMRRLLGVLREDAEIETNRRPQPGLQQLVDLVDEVRDASRIGTRLIVRGPVTPLDPGVELIAYRIVQEALTNARRHAPGAPVDVELSYADDGLHLRIRDSGPGADHEVPADPIDGHGLMGMRERAAMVGGRLTVGPSPGSGFVVEAQLPASGPVPRIMAE
jgi:signal transduction histidine kinase